MSGQVTITVNGAALHCASTATVAAALLDDGRGPALRRTDLSGQPRGLFCGMGLCFDCLVTVDGRPDVRACITNVRDGMRIEVP